MFDGFEALKNIETTVGLIMGKQKKNGPYKKSSWSSYEGRLTEKGNLKNGKLDGVFEIYYDNGQLHTRGNYTEGIPVGLWEYFHDSGLLQTKIRYKQGVEGYYFEENYHENGELAKTGHYKNTESDVLFDGLHERFYENGQVSMRRWYNDNEPLGEAECFNQDGEPIDFDEYKSYQDAEMEEELAAEEFELTSEEFYVERFIVVASYYVFHADNEFPDPKWGEKHRKTTSFLKELHRWRKVCGKKRTDKFQHDYQWAGTDTNSEDYEFQGHPTYEQKIAYLKEELINTASVMNEVDEESRVSALKTEFLKLFAIGQIIDITYASGFISDAEMSALYEVGELITLDQDEVRVLLEAHLDSKD